MKKNGFVFIETLVVVSVLSLTLLMLFGSYSYIIRKSRERNDTTEMIYKTYYTKQILEKEYGTLGTYMNTCNKLGTNVYECPISGNRLTQLKQSFEVEKIYFLTPSEVLTNTGVLVKLDATTIDYIKHLGKYSNTRRMIVKYKKNYQDGTYEVFHSSMEV